jgi:2-dehydropantoate 2-reductase
MTPSHSPTANVTWPYPGGGTLAPGALQVLVMGAGSVGGFVGGSLQAVGVKVQMVGRPRMLGALRAHGLTLTDLRGQRQVLAAHELQLFEAIPSGATPDLVLLCVKCGGTAEAARQLGGALPAGTPVLCLQNGVGNAALGASLAPNLVWLPGMVPYNIAELGPGQLHRGTGGRLAAQDHPVVRRLAPACAQSGLGLQLEADLMPVLWGKLLVNLNNPVNALSGLPLRAELLDAGYRRVFAALQLEALQVLRAAGIAPAQVVALKPNVLPRMLQLPTWLFRRLASRMLKIDAQARSSMADDLALGRPTEVDALCGDVVRMAMQHGISAPLNARMVSLVEGWPQRRLPWPAAELARALRTPTKMTA